jgi:hypothetical protein
MISQPTRRSVVATFSEHRTTAFRVDWIIGMWLDWYQHIVQSAVFPRLFSMIP